MSSDHRDPFTPNLRYTRLTSSNPSQSPIRLRKSFSDALHAPIPNGSSRQTSPTEKGTNSLQWRPTPGPGEEIQDAEISERSRENGTGCHVVPIRDTGKQPIIKDTWLGISESGTSISSIHWFGVGVFVGYSDNFLALKPSASNMTTQSPQNHILWPATTWRSVLTIIISSSVTTILGYPLMITALPIIIPNFPIPFTQFPPLPLFPILTLSLYSQY